MFSLVSVAFITSAGERLINLSFRELKKGSALGSLGGCDWSINNFIYGLFIIIFSRFVVSPSLDSILPRPFKRKGDRL